MLGAYGGVSGIETPALDTLAAESIVFDSFYATSLNLDALCRAFWRGESPANFKVVDEPNDVASIFRVMKQRGFRTFLISDVESVALCPCIDSDDCDDRLLLDGNHANEPGETLEETGFFKNFEELTRFLAKLNDNSRLESNSPWFVWAHFSGWNERWDFPMTLREQFRETFLDDNGDVDEKQSDPASYAATVPPYWRRPSLMKRGARNRRDESSEQRKRIDDHVEPALASLALNEREYARLSALDEVERRQSVLQAYAGGLSAFDETLGGFIAFLKESGLLKNTLLALSGVRGFAFGEPSGLGIPRKGDETSPFYTEETRVPLMIRLPNGIGATVRLPTLCEPRDLFATLCDWPDFASTLADPDFWRVEKIEISPLAGVWSADDKGADSNAGVQKNAGANLYDLEPYRELAPDAPGQNLLPFLVNEEGSARNAIRIVAVDADSPERALVVDKWFIKRTPIDAEAVVYETDPTERLELFVLPDDRYCVNDVADRCADVVETLSQALDAQK